MIPCNFQINILEIEYVNNQFLESAVRKLKFTLLTGLLCAFLPVFAVAETRLIMFDSIGCTYCMRWEREIGPIYTLTAEGKSAPLTRVNVHGNLPEGVTLARRAVYTPTFVLLDNGVEVNRIEGYPGEDFFWGLLEKMLHDLTDPVIKS